MGAVKYVVEVQVRRSAGGGDSGQQQVISYRFQASKLLVIELSMSPALSKTSPSLAALANCPIESAHFRTRAAACPVHYPIHASEPALRLVRSTTRTFRVSRGALTAQHCGQLGRAMRSESKTPYGMAGPPAGPRGGRAGAVRH